jgi:hypothetical protein
MMLEHNITNNRLFSGYEDIRLQQINGVNLSPILHSRCYLASTSNIANDMREQLNSRIARFTSNLSVLIHEATSASNKTTTEIYRIGQGI